MRPTWDQTYADLAKLVAKRATCPRASVGAVLVRDNRVLATGYNGAPPKAPHCTDDGCMMVEGHCIRAVHAEANALLTCARHGVSTEGATCYVTVLPCVRCFHLLQAAGINRIVYLEEYKHSIEANYVKSFGFVERSIYA